MEKVWKKRFKFKGWAETTSIYISRGTDKWWVNSYLFGYWDFDTYVDAERFFLLLTKSLERIYNTFDKLPTFEDFKAKVESLRLGHRRVVFDGYKKNKRPNFWIERRAAREEVSDEVAES